MEDQICFGCLQRRIQTDLSDKLIFRYGISDCAVPLGSKAVVQILLSSEGDNSACEEVSRQFLLVGVPNHEDGCLLKYIDGYTLEDFQNDSMYGKESKTSSEIVPGSNAETLSVASSNTDSRCSVSYSSSIPVMVACDSSRNCYTGRFSCSRTITALAPVAYVGTGSYSVIKDIACKFLSSSVESHIISSLNLIIEGKPTGRDGANLLSLVGMPTFSENNVPGCIRHPNIVPLLGMLKMDAYINLLYPKSPYTLENLLHYSPKALKSDWHIRFLVYQILSALLHIHSLGVAHGSICPANVMLTDSCWSWLTVFDKPQARGNPGLRNEEGPAASSSGVNCSVENCSSQTLYTGLRLSPSIDWHSDFKRWWKGELSNYDYLLVLNRLAGRRWGDHTFHTVMPWVIDFSVKPDEGSDAGWRDLQKSKWRLAKGDEQLDFTYSTSEIPHHVSDECLSELAVCSYKARRLPLSLLRSAVRSVYEPNEYPSNMQRLYQWTPDECIPEFYSDPQNFVSLHSGMNDLAVPAWASSPEEFISLHRAALESNRVSRQIHHWFDITFGCKMSGRAAIEAKNVMLPVSDPMMPRASARRQLFTRPHPTRRSSLPRSHYSSKEPAKVSSQVLENHVNISADVISSGVPSHVQAASEKLLLSETGYLEELEEAVSFCEHAMHLSPVYRCHQENVLENVSSLEPPKEHFKPEIAAAPGSDSLVSSDINLGSLLEYFEDDNSGSMGFQELLFWGQNLSSETCSEDVAGDIFSIGCILAELYLNRPLFSPTTLSAYIESGILPRLIQELPPSAKLVVEASIQRDWRRRPSAKLLLESPYFPATVRSAYLFLAPLYLLAKNGCRLQYAAKLSREGALKSMGTFAAEMCVPYCVPFIVTSSLDVEAESALYLLVEFLKCLKSQAVKILILPIIQKILQAMDYSHLKVSVLQNSFVRELWKRLGKQSYLARLHPLVISNLYVSPHKNSASAAAVLLIGSCEELGVPITVHQTILPLLHSFGKGLCSDGIDALVRIGGLLGDNFIVKQLLPLLRNVILSCIDVSCVDKPEPLQSWNALALIDCLATLDGLVAVLPREIILKELIQDQVCLHVKVLTQIHLDLPVLQVAATTLIAVCQRIGADSTSLHILPQLKELFDELAFAQETVTASGSVGRNNLKVSRSKTEEDTQTETRMDLVLLLYPSFASLLGIEKLRQCCATWLLLEQFLQRVHNWKWEYIGEASKSAEHMSAQRLIVTKISSSECNPAKRLLNGVGWSIPQPQSVRGGKSSISYKQVDEFQKSSATKDIGTASLGKREPWFWFPSPATSWDGPDFLGRVGSPNDDLPWKVRASILYSVRAHPGTLRTIAVCDDECTVFTGGVGPGFKGTVQRWELPRMDCISGYYGHEEVVHDICVLSDSGKIASCDGTIHIWNSQTGKPISIYAEPSTNSSNLSRMNNEQANMLNSNTLSGGILSSGSLYTCMYHIESDNKLVAGMVNGSLRFIDVAQDQKLHLWRSDPVEHNFSSFVSAICSCGSGKLQERTASSSWIAAGLSSGHCRLLDARSGNVMAFWRAHDGYITKLAAQDDHLLVSSSLDKTLRVWDLRRNFPSQRNVFRGHSDGISGFAMWGQDVISVSRNKIGLSSLSGSVNEDGQQRLSPQKLYSVDRGTRNLSILSSISILPFSRLFLVGTEDGYLKLVEFMWHCHVRVPLDSTTFWKLISAVHLLLSSYLQQRKFFSERFWL